MHELQEKYPLVYGNIRFGYFECGEGWYEILDETGEQLQQIAEKYRNEPPETPVIVKEKFGALEIQAMGFWAPSMDVDKEDKERFREIISEAREKSLDTCELCGQKAERRDHGGWIVTRCNSCWKAKE